VTLKREKSNKQRAEELALEMGQSICTEKMVTFFGSFFFFLASFGCLSSFKDIHWSIGDPKKEPKHFR